MNTQRAGYILAMRLLQSDIELEDDEKQAISVFAPAAAKATCIKDDNLQTRVPQPQDSQRGQTVALP